MMILRTFVIAALCVCATQAVLNKEFKRREAPFDTYGPPQRPAQQYGPPQQQQHIPHRQYGVPQQIPFREYGAPSQKYGPPKLNFIGNSHSSSSGSGLHEQIKTHFGVPKPYYGPPHIEHRPSSSYGPPPQQQPKPVYGPPPKPVYGPPPIKIEQHRPAPNYGPPPKQSYGPPPKQSYGPPPQQLPLFQPGPSFKPEHTPASSYGPPPSGPLSFPPQSNYGPPKPNYGPPPLPLNLPGPQQANFNKIPETTIILTSNGNGNGNGNGHHHGGPGPVKQVQIQIDASGHTHSISGSQAPFQTACDGWKPIPAPVGSYVEHNQIETQGGYSQVSQGTGPGIQTQYNAPTGIGGGGSGSGNVLDGLTDEQLVAVALQSGGFDGNVNSIDLPVQNLPQTGPGVEFNKHNLNSIETQALQLSFGAFDDSYSKPPADSFAPGSGHGQRYNNGPPPQAPSGNYGPPPQPPSGNYGPPPQPPSGNYGPPPPRPSGNYGPPPQAPSGNYGPPPSRPSGNYGPPPQAPSGNYGPPPPPPSGNYGPPPPPPSGNYGPPPQQPRGNYGPPPQPPRGNYGPPPQANFEQHHHEHQQQQQHSSSATAGLNYGTQSGNVQAFPPNAGVQPSKPVVYRPPVPQGLLESIGASVAHLDQFGVKPPSPQSTYIPPAANEIPETGPSNVGPQYGPPLPQPAAQQGPPPQQFIFEQQLPQPQPPRVFSQAPDNQYGPPPSLPQQQYLPPQQLQQQSVQANVQIESPAQQYLPPAQQPPTSYQQQYNSFGNSQSSSQFQQQFVHTQGLPLQQEPRFNQVHDCGHGPNLIGGVGYQVQQQDQQQHQQHQQQQQQQQYQQQEQFQQQQFANSVASSILSTGSNSLSGISQSIPVAEQHTQFIAVPNDSYGPPASGNSIDHAGYASEKSAVTALPDGTNPQNLPGLDGLNVISAQKSHSIQLTPEHSNSQQRFQIQVGGSQATAASTEQHANHDEILSQGLLQSILTAIEQPQQQQQQQQNNNELPPNHKAQSRSDTDVEEEATTDDASDDIEPELAESNKVEVKVLASNDDDDEVIAVVKELKPIVPEEVDDIDAKR